MPHLRYPVRELFRTLVSISLQLEAEYGLVADSAWWQGVWVKEDVMSCLTVLAVDRPSKKREYAPSLLFLGNLKRDIPRSFWPLAAITFAGMSAATAYRGNARKAVECFDERHKVRIYFLLWHGIALCSGMSYLLCLIFV
jgi:hypothetical protein